jgi:hypothetical protein
MPHTFPMQPKVQQCKFSNTLSTHKRTHNNLIALDDHRYNSTAISSPRPSGTALSIPIHEPGSATQLISSTNVVHSLDQYRSKQRRTDKACSQYTTPDSKLAGKNPSPHAHHVDTTILGSKVNPGFKIINGQLMSTNYSHASSPSVVTSMNPSNKSTPTSPAIFRRTDSC